MRTRSAILTAALFAQAGLAGVPQHWDIELVCRSSLDPSIPAFRLPQGSSLSSQYVSLDSNVGLVAIRVFLSGGGASEGIFLGGTGGGQLEVTANSSEPVWSTSIDYNFGYLAVQDTGFGALGVSVYDVISNTETRFDPTVLSATGGPSVDFNGSIGYRVNVGLAGQAIVFDRFVGGMRQQDTIYSTLDLDVDDSFILTPKMNPARSFVANTIPNSGPSRRIIRLDPNGPGGAYTRSVIAETGPNADGNFTGFVNSTSIAQSGAVAFSGRRAEDGLWQVSRREGPASPIVSIARGGDAGIINSNLANFPPVTNSNGLVAFRVEDTAGSTALFVGDGSGGAEGLVRVVGLGDIAQTDLGPIPFGFDFGGTTGIQVMNGVVDLNDADQIAFAAFLQNGTIGVFIATPGDAPNCNPADLAEPFAVLDLADIQAFVAGFLASDPIADLAAPQGVFDLADIQAFVTEFTAGCP